MNARKGSILYSNKKYGFTLQIPAWWKPNVCINKKRIFKATESTRSFRLKYRRSIKGQRSTTIFSILVFNMSPSKWKEKYGHSPLQYITSKHGRVFAYLVPNEPPEEFLRKDKMDYDRSLLEFRALVKMVNEEVPAIVKSFRFVGKK